MRVAIVAWLALAGCSTERWVRVVVETADEGVVVDSLVATATVPDPSETPRGEARGFPESGRRPKLPADFAVLIGDASGRVTASVIAFDGQGRPVASGTGAVDVPPGGEGRVGEIVIRLARGAESGCGDGVFTPGEICLEPRWLPVVGQVGRSTLVDVDEDGVDDLVSASNVEGGRSVSISLGLGGGQFGAPTYPLPSGGGNGDPPDIAKGDLNEDGQTDLALTGSWDRPPILLMSRERGGLAAPAPLPEGPPGLAPRIGDLDGDGHLDLVARSDQVIWVGFGDGSGAFPREARFGETDGINAVELAELDGEAGVEIVAAVNATDQFPELLTVLQVRDGALEPIADVGDAPAAFVLSAANLDGQEPPELVLAANSTLQVYRWGDGGGLERTFEVEVPITPESDSLWFIRSIVPIARSGGPDDVVLLMGRELWNDDSTPVAVVQMRPGPDGLELAEVSRETMRCPDALGASSDVDGDGNGELLASCNESSGLGYGVAVLHVDDDGLPLATRTISSSYPHVVGDVDADGLPDLVRADQQGTLALNRNAHLPDFADTSEIIGTVPNGVRDMRAVDLDGDLASEIVAACACWDGLGLHVFRRGAVGFVLSSAHELESDGDSPRAISPVRLAEGAAPSLVAALENGDLALWPAPLESVETATIAGVLVEGGSGGLVLTTGELDGSAGQDVLASYRDSGILELFRGDGEGGLSEAIEVGVDPPSQLAVVDLGGDGHDEVAMLRGDPVVLDVVSLGEGGNDPTTVVSTPLPQWTELSGVVDLDGVEGPELVVSDDAHVLVYDLGGTEPALRLVLPGFRQMRGITTWSLPTADGRPSAPLSWITARPGWGNGDGTWYVMRWMPRP